MLLREAQISHSHLHCRVASGATETRLVSTAAIALENIMQLNQTPDNITNTRGDSGQFSPQRLALGLV
jgi:hypothetical protein